MSDTERPETGCSTCDRVNLTNATFGIMQAVSCDTNEIESVDEAIELVRRDIEFQRSVDTDTNQPEP